MNQTSSRMLPDRPAYPSYLPFLATLLLAAGVSLLGFATAQHEFYTIALGYGLAFAGYLIVLRSHTQSLHYYYLGLAVLLRVLLLFAFPGLSDDIYRFIWDGRLLTHGLNPFDHLPAYYLQEGHEVPGLSKALFAQLNSPAYYTIYPPVAQAVFWLSCILFPESIYGSTLVMKLFLLGCEVGSIWLLVRLLAHWQMPAQNVFLYALNPLILVEIMGNLHFEGAMVFFLLLGLWLLLQKRVVYAAAAFALSIASKLLPLLFLPFLLRRLAFPRRWLIFFGSLGLILLLLFFPLFNGVFLENIGQSLDLYFRKFEFNASLYYLVRQAGFWWKGYNLIALIGPVLAAIVALLVFAKALLEKSPLQWQHLPAVWLFAISVYLFCATTVHPWYLSLPIVLCCFTQWRYPILWSALIVLTYVHYSDPDFREHYGLIALEYGLVFSYLIWEKVKIESRV